MKELTLKEIHEATLGVMDFIHGFCEKNQITYYLAYGTLIGAVRHKGFIPWDDDFDIIMMRDDFDRFCDLMEKEPDATFKLLNRRNTKGFLYGIPRVTDTRYRFVSDFSNNKEEIPLGVFVDVYPFDHFGNSHEQAEEIVRHVLKINTLFAVYLNPVSEGGGIKGILKKPLHYVLRLCYGDNYHKRVDRKILSVIKGMTSPEDRYIGQVTWEPGCVQFEPDWFNKRMMAPFEDRQYWIPCEYDRILDSSYSNYRILPPEEKRITSHHYKIYRK